MATTPHHRIRFMGRGGIQPHRLHRARRSSNRRTPPKRVRLPECRRRSHGKRLRSRRVSDLRTSSAQSTRSGDRPRQTANPPLNLGGPGQQDARPRRRERLRSLPRHRGNLKSRFRIPGSSVPVPQLLRQLRMDDEIRGSRLGIPRTHGPDMGASHPRNGRHARPAL